FDNLGLRPRGTLGHYMTYSGLLVLVMGAALARVLFGKRDRVWAGLVMPALVVAVVLTFTRSAWVGGCAARAAPAAPEGVRAVAVAPVAAAVLIAAAPTRVSERMLTTLNVKDPTARDRIAMLHEGAHMVRDHPLFGVGPNMVPVVYEQYREPDAVEKVNPHL